MSLIGPRKWQHEVVQIISHTHTHVCEENLITTTALGNHKSTSEHAGSSEPLDIHVCGEKARPRCLSVEISHQ